MFLGSGKSVAAFALILVVVGLSAFGAAVLRHEVRSSLLATLRAVLSSNQSSLDEWIEHHSYHARLWASNETLIQATGSLLLVKDDRELLLASPAQAQLRRSLDDQLRQSAYRGFFVIAPDGTSLASSRDANIGTPNLLLEHQDFFDRILAGETVVTTPLPSDVPLPDAQGNLIPRYPTMFSGAPIRGENGTVIAVLTFRINPFHRYDAIANKGRTGLTGETYFFDEHGVMISRSRFERQLVDIEILQPGQSSILSVEIRDPGANLIAGKRPPSDYGVPPLTRMAAEATKGNAGESLDGYRDYRGVPVVGVWIWDERHGYGIATEVDYEEAYAYLEFAYVAIGSLSVLASVLILAFALFAHRSDLRQVREAQLLREAKRDAEIANEAKSSFLAAMSHELRTPLNAIIGFSDIMKNETFGPVGSPRYRDYANDINVSGQHLLNLINDVLDLSKIESGARDLQEEVIEISPLVRSVERLMADQAQRGGVQLELDVPDSIPAMSADPRKLLQILLNLISNAIKFTPASGKVTLRTRASAKRGFLFQIIDTGIGMTPQEIPRALTPFQQVHSNLSREHKGTGIGLPLSKALVEMHGGTLDIQSEVGIGTTITLCFPTERIAPSAHQSPVLKAAAGRQAD